MLIRMDRFGVRYCVYEHKTQGSVCWKWRFANGPALISLGGKIKQARGLPCLLVIVSGASVTNLKLFREHLLNKSFAFI